MPKGHGDVTYDVFGGAAARALIAPYTMEATQVPGNRAPMYSVGASSCAVIAPHTWVSYGVALPETPRASRIQPTFDNALPRDQTLRRKAPVASCAGALGQEQQWRPSPSGASVTAGGARPVPPSDAGGDGAGKVPATPRVEYADCRGCALAHRQEVPGAPADSAVSDSLTEVSCNAGGTIGRERGGPVVQRSGAAPAVYPGLDHTPEAHVEDRPRSTDGGAFLHGRGRVETPRARDAPDHFSSRKARPRPPDELRLFDSSAPPQYFASGAGDYHRQTLVALGATRKVDPRASVLEVSSSGEAAACSDASPAPPTPTPPQAKLWNSRKPVRASSVVGSPQLPLSAEQRAVAAAASQPRRILRAASFDRPTVSSAMRDRRILEASGPNPAATQRRAATFATLAGDSMPANSGRPQLSTPERQHPQQFTKKGGGCYRPPPLLQLE